jgi:hypothetical protein
MLPSIYLRAVGEFGIEGEDSLESTTKGAY